MTKAGEQPTITQSDRDAASDLLRATGKASFSWSAKNGRDDNGLTVQAFARHRTTSLAAQGDFYSEGNVIFHRSDGDVLKMGEMHDHVIANVFASAMNERSAPSLAAQDGLVEALEVYADTLCEFGTSSDACGKCDDDVCFGCRARRALSAIKGDKS